MTTVSAIKHELASRLADVDAGKVHLSVRYEPLPKIVRIGVCVTNYNWEIRDQILDRLIAFEGDHVDDYAVEFDIIPLEGVADPTYAEA